MPKYKDLKTAFEEYNKKQEKTRLKQANLLQEKIVKIFKTVDNRNVKNSQFSV